MHTSLIVVDDFLESPQALREAARGLEFPQMECKFPGRNSSRAVLIDGLDQAVSRIVGEPLVGAPGQAHGKLRLSLAGERGRAKVHVDPSHWSGILYLSRPEHCRGGTEFFRHLPTGTDRAAFNDAEAQAKGFASAKQMTDDIVGRDTMDESKWEMTQRVPMRFNRLLLLRPWLWHTAGESFGSSLEDGRLVYLLFFVSARG